MSLRTGLAWAAAFAAVSLGVSGQTVKTSYTNPDEVPWATLSANDLAALDPFLIIAAAQPNQIGQIPGMTMRGLLRRQVEAMSEVIAAGLTVAQVSNLTMEGSSMIFEIVPPCPFKERFMARMRPDTFAGLQRDCVREFLPTALASISADAFFFMTPRAVSGMNKDLVRNLNPRTAFKRATPEHFAAWDAPAYNDDDVTHPCAGFTAQHFFEIAEYTTVKGFGPGCVRRFPKDTFSMAVPEQLLNLRPEATSAMTKDHISGIKTNSCPGISKTMLESFESPYNMTVPEMCQGFQPACVGLITELDTVGFGPRCVAQMPNNAFSEMKTITLMRMKLEAFGGFKAAHVAGLTNPAILGLSADIVRALNPAACSGFTSDQVDSVKDPVFAGFTAECLSKMTGTAFARIRPSQFAYLGGDTAKGFTADLLKSISPGTISGLTAVFLSNLNPDACTGFTGDQLKALPNSTFTGFTAVCIAKTTPQIWSAVSSSQLSAIPASAFSGFSPLSFKAIPASSMVALKPDQMAKIDPLSCATFQGDQIASLPLSAIGGLTSPCFDLIPSTSLDGLSRGELGYLSLPVIVNMTAKRVQTLPISAVSGFFPAQLSNLGPDACVGFSAEQIGALGRNASGLRDGCVAKFANDCVSKLRVADILALSPNGTAGFGYERLFRLVQRMGTDLVDAWGSDQLSLISPQTAFAVSLYFNSDCCSPNEFLVPLKAITAASLNSTLPSGRAGKPVGISSSWLQVLFLQDSEASKITAEFLEALPTRSVLGLRRGHIRAMPAQAFSNLDLERASFLNPESVRSLTGEQLGTIPADTIRKVYIRSLDPLVVPSITTDQIRRLQPSQFSSEIMPCLLLGNFTDDQINTFTPDTEQAYAKSRQSCSMWTAPRGKPQPAQPGDQCFVTCDPDGKSVFETGSTASLKPKPPNKPNIRNSASRSWDSPLALWAFSSLFLYTFFL